MSGNENNPQAGTGQSSTAEQYRDDGAAQLAHALIAQLERIGASTTTTVQGLTLQEARLATHYALLSNVLGNFGRHGTPRLALLSPAPTLVSQGKATRLVFGPPIEGAVTVTTYDAGGRRLQHLAYLVDGVYVQDPDTIRTVEIEDSHGIPFRVGFVTTPSDSGTN